MAFGAHCRRSAGEYVLTCMLERNGQVHTVTRMGSGVSVLGVNTWHALEREFAGE